MKIDQNTDILNREFTLRKEVENAVRLLGDKQLTVGFAESCTGGLLSSLITEQSGVSDVYMGSVVSYDNKVKANLLGVSEESLKKWGAVSSQVAKQMAKGARKNLKTSIATSITGVAGPTGGSLKKPVGTIYVAVAGTKVEVSQFLFKGDRKSIQIQSSLAAVKKTKQFIQKMR